MTNQITASTDIHNYITLIQCRHDNVLVMYVTPTNPKGGSYRKRICQDCGAEVSCYD